MIENVGELKIQSADDANIPVDIWLRSPDKMKEEECFEYDGTQDSSEELWLLTANNYMPRRACLAQDGWAYKVWGTEAELRELIKKHILPLYETAVKILQGMVSGKPDCHLYYWQLPKEK